MRKKLGQKLSFTTQQLSGRKGTEKAFTHSALENE